MSKAEDKDKRCFGTGEIKKNFSMGIASLKTTEEDGKKESFAYLLDYNTLPFDSCLNLK